MSAHNPRGTSPSLWGPQDGKSLRQRSYHIQNQRPHTSKGQGILRSWSESSADRNIQRCPGCSHECACAHMSTHTGSPYTYTHVPIEAIIH